MTQRYELQVENLKNETEEFNVECRNKIEDGKRSRGADLVWQIGESEQDQQEIDVNSSFGQRARLENKDVKRRLNAKLSRGPGPIQPRLTPAVIRHLQILTRSLD